jgi:Holliday junction DNA helicase RuvA
MIDYLRGKILAVEEERIVLDVNGVGYGLMVPESSTKKLAPGDSEKAFFVTTVVREDAISLYGFRTREEKSVFDIFLHVSGIGPRTALDVLSVLPIPDFVMAVRTGNVNTLTRVPGIGRKKAERLIVELKDKLKLFPASSGAGRGESDEGAVGLEVGGEFSGGQGDLFEEAMAGMMALGYKQAYASRAVAAALRSAPPEKPLSVEELLKRSLQQMTR